VIIHVSGRRLIAQFPKRAHDSRLRARSRGDSWSANPERAATIASVAARTAAYSGWMRSTRDTYSRGQSIGRARPSASFAANRKPVIMKNSVTASSPRCRYSRGSPGRCPHAPRTR
jgi:hypothetical protein